MVLRVTKLRLDARPHAWRPPTDVFENENGYTIRVEIAGMHEEDFLIQYDQHVLVISGRRPLLNDKCAYHRMEIPSGDFLTSVELPMNIDIQRAAADYENGFLTIRIPRKSPINVEIHSKEDN